MKHHRFENKHFYLENLWIYLEFILDDEFILKCLLDTGHARKSTFHFYLKSDNCHKVHTMKKLENMACS
jgi:hypothetical protein